MKSKKLRRSGHECDNKVCYFIMTWDIFYCRNNRKLHKMLSRTIFAFKVVYAQKIFSSPQNWVTRMQNIDILEVVCRIRFYLFFFYENAPTLQTQH